MEMGIEVIELGRTQRLGWLTTMLAICAGSAVATQSHEAPMGLEGGEPAAGILLKCTGMAEERGMRAMAMYLTELKIASSVYRTTADAERRTIRYQLRTAAEDTNTLDLINRPELWINEESVALPSGREIATVSPKEIVAALMQNGRESVFEGESCGVEALRQHVGMRRNIVTWAEKLEWGWPEGGPAKWNRAFWNKGTPISMKKTADSLMDSMLNQQKYAVGCYTAAKMVIAHGILDFYKRVLKDKHGTAMVEAALASDGDPLVGIEPSEMWEFEEDYDSAKAKQPGKLLTLQRGVAAKNFVPGDWVYFVNTDKATREKTGYEGSNAIYLGRGRFSDYYNDNEHFYSFEQKLDEVFQWRNGVFSRSRHFERAVVLTRKELEGLARAPEEGGVLLPMRAVPREFAGLLGRTVKR